MKLHLPKKFQTALMAAFATVSFTTVSTASLGAAIFAFAGYQAAAEEATTTEQSEADQEGQEEIRDNIRILQEKQDEENERETTVDPVDRDVMERRAKNLERAGDAAASGLAKEAYEQMEAEMFTPATSAAPAQQQTSTGSGELPSDDLGFTTNPYASSSPANSGPVFEVTPAAATTTDFLKETTTKQESTSPSSSGSSTPAPASSSGFGSSANSGYVPFGRVSSTSIPLGVSAIPLGASTTPELIPLGAAGEANATNLVWEGDVQSKGTWQDGGDDASSPWRFTPEASDPRPQAFHNGDIVLFEKSAEVTVSGNVLTDSLQLNKGTADNMLVVTINTGAGDKLTANHVVTTDVFEQGSFYNKIVKKGAGEIDFTINDPSFDTILDIQEGTANITFDNGQSFNLYENILGSDSSHVVLNFENGTKTESHVQFSGIDEYNVADGVTLQIDSAIGAGGGFYLNKADTTISLGDTKSMLNSTAEAVVETHHLTITGKGEAYFNEMHLNHGNEGVAVHDLRDSVYVNVSYLMVESPSTIMQVDDASTLLVKNMYAGKNSTDQAFLHAFQNDGFSAGDRQYITVQKLFIGEKDEYGTVHLGTVHLGAASTTQGADEGYQEAGTVNVGHIEGWGTVVLENNAEVKHEGQSLTEVFKLNEGKDFSGNIRLAADNDGTKDQQKKAVILFQRYDTPYYCDLELQADADYTEYALIMSDAIGLSTQGIQDVESGVKANSSAMIYSGTISDDKNAVCTSDDIIRTIYLFADSKKNYESSFGMSENIDIDFTGAGSQTFKGDFSKFKGDVTVGGKKSLGSTLRFIEQKTALNIVDLMLRPDARLDVKASGNQNQLIKVSGKLTAQSQVEALSGDSAVVNGDLEMEAGSVYDVSAFYGEGGLDLNGSLTFVQGAQLSDEDMSMILGMPIDEGLDSMYDLAFHVTSLNGSDAIRGWTEDGKMIGDPIDASTIFTGQFSKGEYYICYSGLNQGGGYGKNVGTVYLYHALPEPTTGTLSLLALAALAARRRRK